MTEDAGFRVCQQCGNTTPASSAQCAHCGAVSNENAAQAANEYRFFQAVFTRSNQLTMTLIGMNVGVFLLEWLAGGMGAMSADHSVLLAFGAKQNSLISDQHQYWRLITCVFLHIGFIHLLLNNYALWIVGRDIEQIYGSARFLILYVVTGTAASVSSFYFSPDAVSAGASGAIFGLFGAMATFAFKYRKTIPAALSKDIRRRLLPIIAINLMFGFSARGVVDNAAHIGGLIAGIALALAIPFKPPEESSTPVVWRALQLVCIVAVMASFVAAYRSYDGPALRFANLATAPGSRIESYFEHMRTAVNSLGESLVEFERNPGSGRPPDAKKALSLVEKGLSAVEATPMVDAQGEGFRMRALEMLRRQKEVLQHYGGSSGASSPAPGDEQALISEYNKFRQEFDPWLSGFMKQNGYELEQRPRKEPGASSG